MPDQHTYHPQAMFPCQGYTCNPDSNGETEACHVAGELRWLPDGSGFVCKECWQDPFGMEDDNEYFSALPPKDKRGPWSDLRRVDVSVIIEPPADAPTDTNGEGDAA